MTDIIRLQDRVILTTYDGQVIVRPKATQDTSILTPCDNVALLNEEGIKAWNTGEDIKPYHVLCAYPRAIMANGIVF